MQNENNDFKPRRKPSIIVEIIATILLHGPTFLIVYFATTTISSCLRDGF